MDLFIYFYIYPSVLFHFFFFSSTSLLLPISLHPHAHMLSHVIPWTSAHQTPLSMDFSRQEYWSGLPFPSPWIYFLINACIYSVWDAINDKGF